MWSRIAAIPFFILEDSGDHGVWPVFRSTAGSSVLSEAESKGVGVRVVGGKCFFPLILILT